MDPSRTLRGFGADDEEKTVVVPLLPYLQGVVSGSVTPEEDWPDARTVVARPGLTPVPPSYIPSPSPVSGEATRILDVNGMHEWISASAAVSEFPQGTASEFDRASARRMAVMPRAQPLGPAVAHSPSPELFALPPEMAEQIAVDNRKRMAILRAVALGFGILALLVGSLALVKPGLLHKAKGAIFPQPMSEPVILSIEVSSTLGGSLNGPSVDEAWVAKASANAAQAMIEGNQKRALSLYQELRTLVPDSEVYAGFVKTLSQKEAKQ